MSLEKKLANAMGGKTARACDSCIRKRARWYCAADDAFLCQFCDVLVHSANPLARGHERVRLKIASLKLSSMDYETPTWHQGFTKKSRTPRGKNTNKHVSHRTTRSNESHISFKPLHLVPEIESDELTIVDSDEQLPFEVPVFGPLLGELYFSGDFDDMAAVPVDHEEITHYNKLTTLTSPSDKNNDESEDPFHLNSLTGLILPSDLELAEFAADVESLLGKSVDEDQSFDIEKLGLGGCRIGDSVKVEEEMMREPFQLSFDYESPVSWEDEDHVKVDVDNQIRVVKNEDEKCDDHVNVDRTDKIDTKMLKLDFEGIIAAWDGDRSPWTTGDRPELDPNDCWLDCMGECEKMEHYYYGDMGMMIMGNTSRLDGGREARVSRYREKRRTRLFSKKIRYEVRKLNAEKRPRMKGRFVKRTSFAA